MLPVPEEKIVRKWRLQPGKMLLIDLEEGRIIGDDEIKRKLAAEHPYEAWLKADPVEAAGTARSARGHASSRRVPNDPSTRLDLQQAFGYTTEDIQFFLEPMAREGDDPVGSMGTDTPIAALSNRPKLLYNYFKQNFAQVTNPPIDPIREELVMSLISMIGPRPNLLGPRGRHASPARSRAADPDRRRSRERSATSRRLVDGRFKTDTLDITWPAAEGADGIGAGARPALREATAAVRSRAQHPDPVRPRRVGRAGADPGPARDLGGASSPDPPGAAHQDRHRRRDRRGARGASFLRAGRLWRRGDQPLSRLRHPRADPHRERPAAVGRAGPEELPEGARQGHPEGHLQDGDLDLPVLLRRADLRCGRAAERFCREILHRHRDDDRGRRSRARSPRRRWSATRAPMATTRSIARCSISAATTPSGCAARRMPGRRRSVAKLQHAVRGNSLGRLPGLCGVDQRPERAAADDPRADEVPPGRSAGAARRGRAGSRHRQALLRPAR